MPASKTAPKPPKQDGSAKSRYHHGDLREALIAAATQLVCDRGAENFSLADACKLAGVSTAAPYKHFRDREEILEVVVARAFEAMSDRSMAAVKEAGEGTLEGIVAMGGAYIGFAIENQALFRLMFGQQPAIKSAEAVLAQGRECFGRVIHQVELYCSQNNVDGDAKEIALRLWTFVHGAASLTIDEDYEIVAPGVDLEQLIRTSAPLLLRP